MDTLPESIKYDGKKYDVTFRTKFSVIYKIASLSPSKQNDTKITFSDFDSKTNTYTFSIGTGGKKLKGTFTTTSTTPSLQRKNNSTRKNKANAAAAYGLNTTRNKTPPDVNGAIIIVRDPAGHILLGEEGVFCDQGKREKKYIEHASFNINDLIQRTKVTHDLYTQLNTAGYCNGANFIVPLVTESSRTSPTKDPSKKWYGSRPRKEKAAAAAGGVIEYGAPKGSKEIYDSSILGTARREFIEEVGYDFANHKRFLKKKPAIDGTRKYNVYLIEVGAAEKTAIENVLRDRYAIHVGEVFDFKFRDPNGLKLNDLTKDALTKI